MAASGAAATEHVTITSDYCGFYGFITRAPTLRKPEPKLEKTLGIKQLER